MSKLKIGTTVTLTTALGSLMSWSATTSEAEMFRCAVPSLPPYVLRSAEKPTYGRAHNEKEDGSQDAARSKQVQHTSDVHYRDRDGHQSEAQNGELVEKRKYSPCGSRG
jgi:hypothetical protein